MKPKIAQCINLLCSLLETQEKEQKVFDIETKQLSKTQKKRTITLEYQEWRRKILIRDEWRCQLCNRVGGKLHCHHIKLWEKHPDLRCDIDNGITLCIDCHHLIHRFYGRK